MKKTNTLLGWAALAACLASCSTDTDTNGPVAPENSKEYVTVSFSATNDNTRTYIEDKETVTDPSHPYIVRWHESGEELNVIFKSYTDTDDNTDYYNWMTATQAEGSYDETTNTTRFEGKIDRDAFDVPVPEFYAVYPATVRQHNGYELYPHVDFTLPAVQTPSVGSYDPAADCLISKKFSFDAQNLTVSYSFSRLIALVKMTLKGISAGETIQTAEFSAPDGIALAGDGVLDFSSASADWSAAEENTVSLDMKNYPVASGDVVVWFSAVPATLTGFTVKVTTTNASGTIYNYEKSVSSSNALPLTASCVSSFSIDLSGYKTEYAAPVKQEKDFTPLTDDSQLEEGYEIIVVNESSEKLYVMTAEYNSPYKCYTSAKVEITEDLSSGEKWITEAEATAQNAYILKLVDKNGLWGLRSSAGTYLGVMDRGYVKTDVYTPYGISSDIYDWKIDATRNSHLSVDTSFGLTYYMGRTDNGFRSDMTYNTAAYGAKIYYRKAEADTGGESTDPYTGNDQITPEVTTGDFTLLKAGTTLKAGNQIIVCADTYLYVSSTAFENYGYKLMTNEAAETTTTKYFAASLKIADGGVNSTPPATISEETATANNAAVFTLIDNGDGTFSLRSEAGKWLNALAKDYNLTLDDTRVTGWSFNPSAKPSSETQLLFQSKYESVPGYLISRYGFDNGFAGNFEVYFDSGSGAVNTGVEVYWRGTAE